MGCRSDYMDPTKAETNSNQVARLLIFVMIEQTKETPSSAIIEASQSMYGNKSMLDSWTVALCERLQNIPEDFIYDGRRKECRELADWWDEHKEADIARLSEEAENLLLTILDEKRKCEETVTRLSKKRDEIISKMSDLQKQTLGLKE